MRLVDEEPLFFQNITVPPELSPSHEKDRLASRMVVRIMKGPSAFLDASLIRPGDLLHAVVLLSTFKHGDLKPAAHEVVEATNLVILLVREGRGSIHTW